MLLYIFEDGSCAKSFGGEPKPGEFEAIENGALTVFDISIDESNEPTLGLESRIREYDGAGELHATPMIYDV